MATDKVDEQEEISTDQAAEAAAFAASFEGTNETAKPASKPEVEAVTPEPEKEPAAKPDDKQEVTQAVAVPKPEDAAPQAPSPKADDSDVKAELRKLHGRIGSLNDQLQQALKAKETEGKPAVLSPVALTRLKDQYPEMADMLEGDISEVIANLAQKSVDPKEIAAMVSKQVEAEKFVMRQEAVTDRHESWQQDCWVVFPTDENPGERTPDYAAWLKTMKPEEAHAFENSQNPAFVIRKLDQFYDWKSKSVKAETEKQQRLKAAVTPQGTARAGPQTLSEEEAERKAFEDSFNT